MNGGGVLHPATPPLATPQKRRLEFLKKIVIDLNLSSSQERQIRTVRNVLRGRLRKNRPLIFFSKINLASNFSYLLDLTSILQNHIQNFSSHVISGDF
jgi:hypothetical protein